MSHLRSRKIVDLNIIKLDSLLKVIETSIIPLTQKSVKNGNKIFGASILYKHDCSELLSAVNNEIESPLWHGEMSALKRFYELTNRPKPKDLIFLSTHEPCSMCLSAITWAGFDNIFYFFSYEESKDDFAIPHDLLIMKEVFSLKTGEYRRKNHYWESYSVAELIPLQPAKKRSLYYERFNDIKKAYVNLSNVYQKNKNENNIPLA